MVVDINNNTKCCIITGW